MWREGLVSVAAARGRWAAHDTAGEAIELQDLTAWKSHCAGNDSSLGNPIAETTIADHSQLREVRVFSHQGTLEGDGSKCNVQVVMATEEILQAPTFDRELVDSDDDDSDTLEDYSGEGSSPIFINPDGSIDVDFSDNEADELEDFISLLAEPSPSMAVKEHDNFITDVGGINTVCRSSSRRTWQRPSFLHPFRDDADPADDCYYSSEDEPEHEFEASTEHNDKRYVIDATLNEISNTTSINKSKNHVQRASKLAVASDKQAIAFTLNINRAECVSSSHRVNSPTAGSRTDYYPEEEMRLRGGANISLHYPQTKMQAKLERSDAITKCSQVDFFAIHKPAVSPEQKKCKLEKKQVSKDGAGNQETRRSSGTHRRTLSSGKSAERSENATVADDVGSSINSHLTYVRKRNTSTDVYGSKSKEPEVTTLETDCHSCSQACTRCSALSKAYRLAASSRSAREGKTTVRLPFVPKKAISIEDAILHLTQDEAQPGSTFIAAPEHQPTKLQRSTSANRVTEELRTKLGLRDGNMAAGRDIPFELSSPRKLHHQSNHSYTPFAHGQRRQFIQHHPRNIPTAGHSYTLAPITSNPSLSPKGPATLGCKKGLSRRHSDTCSSCSSCTKRHLVCSRCMVMCKRDDGVFTCNACIGVQRIKNAFVLELYADRPSPSATTTNQHHLASCYGIRVGIGLLPLVVVLLSLFVCCSLLLLVGASGSSCASERANKGESARVMWKWLD